MSIRLHELAKKLGMDNKDLMVLLKERDYPVKTVSSTIDKITAEALEQELAKKPAEAAPGAPTAPAGAAPGETAGVPEPAAPVQSDADKPPSFTTRVPAGVFVRSAQDIAREKEELAKASRPQVVFPAPRPAPMPTMRVSPSVQSRPPVTSFPVNRPAPPPVRISPPPAMPPPLAPPPVRLSPSPVPPPVHLTAPPPPGFQSSSPPPPPISRPLAPPPVPV
ncbi:MAG TPA: translation initiation factor IF-2 N-terminal domain-containing protein, partial [Opitutaceae bacterium]|nr:translation initiation factor IF-2 N-terminal domain-containing protein [Opitutaceae bacterium]